MRSFLTAFICLSTIVLAQNVIAAAKSSEPLEADQTAVGAIERTVTANEALVGEAVRSSPASVLNRSSGTPETKTPTPGTMMLLVAGLSGLTAVGARNEDRAAAPSKQQSTN